jgi:hypothetical protein
MFWLYILVPLIILFGAAVVINRRRRHSISGSESTAELVRARAESTWREGRLSRTSCQVAARSSMSAARLSSLARPTKSGPTAS